MTSHTTTTTAPTTDVTNDSPWGLSAVQEDSEDDNLNNNINNNGDTLESMSDEALACAELMEIMGNSSRGSSRPVSFNSYDELKAIEIEKMRQRPFTISTSTLNASSSSTSGSTTTSPTTIRPSRLAVDNSHLLFVAEIIKNEIHKAVEEKLYIYSQDRLNKADYALSSGGAKIISPLTSPTYEMWPTQWHQRIMAAITGHGITRGKPPITALQPETHVGQCWPFAGPKGQLAVLLSRRIYVTAITYDHVSKDIAMGVTSAPKEFEVWGFVDDVPEVIIDNSYPKQGHEPLLLKQTDDVIQEEKQESIFGDHSAIPSDLNDTNDTSNPNDAANNPSESSSDEKNGDERDLKLGSSPNHLFLGKFTYDINGSTIQTFEALRYSKPIIAVLMKILEKVLFLFCKDN
ncbi:23044_t:CDS:2 [Entrophospora sp. SA101]|nr:23044_t:CDS:2 [Entrophospora sp. SA101]